MWIIWSFLSMQDASFQVVKIVSLSRTCHRTSLYFTSSSVVDIFAFCHFEALCLEAQYVIHRSCLSPTTQMHIYPFLKIYRACLFATWLIVDVGLGRFSFCPYGLLIRLHSLTSQQSCRSSEAGWNFIFT